MITVKAILHKLWNRKQKKYNFITLFLFQISNFCVDDENNPKINRRSSGFHIPNLDLLKQRAQFSFDTQTRLKVRPKRML